ncbi:MAG: ABC transporter substrate-binding protein, partial [Anaerotignaceae bacterium]
SPLESSNGWSLTSHGISESVYMQDENGQLVSRFVSDIEQVDDYNWNITLNEDVYFTDGTLVNAEAFSNSMNNLMEGNVAALVGTAGKMECTPTGDFSVNIKTENITSTLQSNLCEYTMVVFKTMENGDFIFTGPYMVKSMDVGVKMELEPNPYYPEAEKRSDVTLMVFGDASAMKLAFESGEIDIASTITADVATMVEASGLNTVAYDAGYQYFIYPNLEREILSDVNVRKAINIALDREEMLLALKGGRVATGMFATYYSFAGETKIETSMDEAKKILDDSGWILNASGVREKDGTPLKLKFITYASRPDLPLLMQIAVSQLEELGIQFETEIVDSIGNACAEGNFDLAFYAQHTAPTGEPTYYLRMAFFEGSSSNYARYSNAKFENIVNQMGTMPLGEERDTLAKEAQTILYNDLPVFYVIDPQWHIGVSERLKDYTPYCGDYYTINSKLGL